MGGGTQHSALSTQHSALSTQHSEGDHMKDIVILGAARTPIGSFLGTLSSLSAPKLGSIAIKCALETARVSPEQVEQVVMGNVLQAAVGQAPARQAGIGAGIPVGAGAVTVNKV